jgi:release factor glutamine methyltransferase
MLDGPTIREVCLQAAAFLERSGATEPARHAEWLVCHALAWDRSRLFLDWGRPFPQPLREGLRAMVERRAQGEPVQYIIGEQEFYGLVFDVEPAVLIPRPETELLVEEMIRLGRRWEAMTGRAPEVADIGTGSGAIAVTLAARCPNWRVFASDISTAALAVAERNAQRNGVGDRVSFYQGNLLQPYIERGIAPDLLVSNPPYIRSADVPGLQVEVAQYEPKLALDGGADGLDLYRQIVAQLSELPRLPDGVGFEVGQGQAFEVQKLLEGGGLYHEVRIVKDLADIDRHVIGLRQKMID